MTEGISKIKNVKKDSTLYCYFDKNGNECDNKEIYYASSLKTGNSIYYKIFCSKDGKILDPVSYPSENSGTIDKLTKCPKYKIRDVNERCFSNYIQYLKIKRRPLLSSAEREI